MTKLFIVEYEIGDTRYAIEAEAETSVNAVEKQWEELVSARSSGREDLRMEVEVTMVDSDSRNIPVEQWGKDHWSMLIYVETRAVDHDGWLDVKHLRTNGARYPTRLRYDEIEDHSDLDCLEDLAAAGYIAGGRATRRNAKDEAVELTYHYELTDDGWKMAHTLRRARAEGKAWRDVT